MVDRLAVFTLTVLFISVPLQFLLSPQSSGELKFHLVQLLDTLRANRFIGQWFVPRELPEEHGEELDESEYNEFLSDALQEEGLTLNKGYYASSTTPRDPRPPTVKWKVGQVIKHKESGYRAVIVGWDERMRAPEVWLEEVHSGRTEVAEQPNYLALIDTRDRHIPQAGYIVEENIEAYDKPVIHPFISKYFERFDGNDRYIPRPWLREIYPYG